MIAVVEKSKKSDLLMQKLLAKGIEIDVAQKCVDAIFEINEEEFTYPNSIEEWILRTKKAFPKSFVNSSNELILEPKNNLYFLLNGVESETDFKCKLFSWLSRPISKGLSKYWSEKVLYSLNELLNTNFSKAEMRQIYSCLGENSNKDLCVDFVESNYDLSLLKEC